MSARSSNPDPETLALLAKLAERVVAARMTTPAILFLETMKPVSFIGSQAIGFFEPMVRMVFQWSEVERLRVAMEDRENIERLLLMIEDKEAARKGGR